MKTSLKRRAVITGIGIVAPTGIGADAHWQNTKQGRSAIRRITNFDPSSYATQLAGEVDGFKPTDFFDQRLVVQTDRWTWLALAAGELALKDASFDPRNAPPYSMSVATASGTGGNEFSQKEIQSLWSKGPLFVGAYQSIAWFYAATTGQLSIKHGMKGPSSVIATEGAGGLDVLAHSMRVIRQGVDTVVSGGTEAPIAPYALTCQIRNGRLSTATDPADAYRPFDVRANGYVPGEGGAILFVEELEHARRRGAPHIYAEILGHAATHDAHHHTDVAPDGAQYARAMKNAMANAGVTSDEVDLVFADAAGTPDGDLAEAQALCSVFGARSHSLPVTAPKTTTGRLYAGGASLDTATALLAMRDGIAPPTINLDQPAEGCDFDFVTQARPMRIDTVLVGARGFGGFNSALVLRRYDDAYHGAASESSGAM